ncbi:MAG TPA: alanyl-tRNA editing protein [Thermoanaerobaculia bacterium]|nr:alanyl-tRNA editing protein [Thermoanaerobaculia bacterium]
MTTLPAYERDPYRRRLDVVVLEIATREPERAGEPRWTWAALDDTLLYPEGGGQPADRGVLLAADRPRVEVLDVQRRDGRVWHRLDAPVDPGPAVLELDWARRWDHMQQHTAQHLLSAIAEDRHGWRTTSFHLGAEVCDVELATPGLDEAQRAALEEEVAAEIRAARPVTARRVSRDQLEVLDERVRTRGLPEGHEGGVRLVEIAGLDLNTCGGTHLRSTAEIETLELLGTERMRGGTRLSWVAGARVRARLAAAERRLAELRGIFECANAELVELARQKLARLEAAEKRVRDLRRSVAGAAARELAGSLQRVVDAHFAEEDGGFLQEVGRAFSASSHAGVALLTSGEGDGASFLVAAGGASGLDAAALGPPVAAALAGRGGGRGPLFQGRAGSLEGRAEALQRLARALER